MNNRLEQHNHGYISRRRSRRPPRQRICCPLCGSDRSRSFQSIYGHGTTEYFSHHGLVVPTHFRRTKRQTVLARECAPPWRMPWGPAILSLVVFGCARLLALALPRLNDLLIDWAYYALWAAFATAMAAVIDGHVFYPRRMAVWARRRICDHCGAVFEAEV